MNVKRHFIIFVIMTAMTVSFASANPLITAPRTDSGGESGKQEKQINPVRITGGSYSLFQKQGDLRNKLADVFSLLSDNSKAPIQSHIQLILVVILISFLYGILHAAGPGHRKTVVFSLYLTRKAPVWEPAIIALLLALLHGGAAIVIMLVFSGVAGSVTANTDSLSIVMEGLSYIILIVTAVFLIIHESITYVISVRNHSAQSADSGHATGLLPFIVSGIYPCPGAILIMVLCFTMHVLRFGIISVLAMSFGMSIPIMAAAYLAWSGRTGLFKMLKHNERAAAKTAFIIEIGGYVFLLLFSLYISWPFLTSLV
jgi:ABC-type nickel/cobalt efflux system permease component RcnA